MTKSFKNLLTTGTTAVLLMAATQAHAANPFQSFGTRINPTFPNPVTGSPSYSDNRVSYQQRNGNGQQSGYVYRNGGNVGVGGSKTDGAGNGWDGSAQHGNGGTQARLGRTQPGEIPGTRMRTWGEVNANGRDSSVAGGRTWSTLNGTELGRTSGRLDGRGYTGESSVGLGGVRAGETSRVGFGGVNTQYEQRQTLRGGPVQGGTHTTVSRKGASTSGSVGVGKHKVQASAKVSTSGGSVKVGGLRASW
jgi:hypothetical protein